MTRRITTARLATVLPGSRWASLVRGVYGLALICSPGRLISARTGLVPSRRACLVARVLGARHLTQALVCATMPTRWLIRAGAAADLLHAGSMVALAAEDTALQPALLTDASVAAAFAAAGGAFLCTGDANGTSTSTSLRAGRIR